MNDNRIICHGNKITLVLSEEEMQHWQKSIAIDIADMISSSYNKNIKVEDFNVEDNRCTL
jgi:hypothetical protein